MIQLPFKLKDSGQILREQLYTHYPTLLQLEPEAAIQMDYPDITKIEFWDGHKWVVPTKIINYGDHDAYIYGYPYGLTHPMSSTGDNDNTTVTIYATTGPIPKPFYMGAGNFDVYNDTGELGYRVWSGNDILFERRFYSESYTPNPQNQDVRTYFYCNNRRIDGWLRSEIFNCPC